MTTYTLKLVGIDEGGSIGRQLKANINGTSVNFSGTTNKHHIIAENIPVNSVTNVPISVNVMEWDAKASDKPFSGSTNMVVGPASTNNPTASLSVQIAEIGGRGKNKGKRATLTFNFVAELKTEPEITYRFEPVVGERGGLIVGAGKWGQPFTHADGTASSDATAATTLVKIYSTTDAGGSCNTVKFHGKDGDNAGAISVYAKANLAGKYKFYFDTTCSIETTGPRGSALLKIVDANGKPVLPNIRIVAKATTLNREKLVSVIVDLPANTEVLVLRYDPTIAFSQEKKDRNSASSVEMHIEAVHFKPLP